MISPQLLSATSCSSHISPAPVWALPTACSPWNKSTPVWALYRLQCGYLLWHGPLHRLPGNTSRTAILGAAGQPLLWHLDDLFSLLLLLPWHPQDFQIFPLAPLCQAAFCPSLPRLSLRCCCHGCRSQPCPAVGLPGANWNQLCSAQGQPAHPCQYLYPVSQLRFRCLTSPIQSRLFFPL